MAKIKKILAPADLSSLSTAGIRLAFELAQWQQAELLIYNVLTLEETPFPQGSEEWVVQQTELPRFKKTLEARKKLLQEFMTENFAEAMAGANVRQELGIGTPYKRIVEKAEQEGCDMIVMSTHGRTGLAHMLIGSVTERVLRRAPCPVLAVPATRRPKRSFRSRLIRRRAGA